MPASNIIQFSLNENQRNKLSTHALEGESIGLTAKRLLLGIIEEQETAKPSQDFNDRLSQLEEEFKVLEQDRDQLLIRIATLQDEKRHLLEEPVRIRMDELTREFEGQLDYLTRATTKFDFLERDVKRIQEQIESFVEAPKQTLDNEGLTK